MTVTVGTLRTNHRTSPLGIDATHPEMSWKLQSDEPNVLQTGYIIELSKSEHFDADTIWVSGRVETDLPFGAQYTGPDLVSMQRYWWRVRVFYTAGHAGSRQADRVSHESAWSRPVWFETAVLDNSLWKAQWIGGPAPSSKAEDPVLYLRGDLDLGSDVVRARAYVSALGWYRFFANGHDATGDAQVPRWTPLSEVVEYQTYDITAALQDGHNVLSIAVGDGRYRGGLGLTGAREVYGNRIGAYAQVEVELADGTTLTYVTDSRWHAGPGRITGSDPKNGERADLRMPDDDWLTGRRIPPRFAPAVVLPEQTHPLIAEEVEPVRAVERLSATVGRAPSGAQILDFGQNFAGVVRIKLAGSSGTVVQMTHTEVLTPAGEVDTASFTNGMKWYQREQVTLAGAPEWYQPWFTIHGFRYVEVTGLDYEIDPNDVQGIVLSSDLKHTGTFESSDGRLNQLRSNVLWSVISNFTDTPTDCPTRERAGWTGDIQAFAPTATVLVDSQAYLNRYLRNLRIEQWDDGFVPIYVPSQHPIKPGIGRSMTHYMSGAVGWSDAAVLLPWTVYRYYGDRHLLERQYESMRKRVDGMVQKAAAKRGGRYILNSGFHFGEWLRPGENPLKTILFHIVRSPSEIATAYFAHSTDVLAKAAAALGRHEDAARYEALFAKIAEAWRSRFVRADGRLALDRQDDYVRALAFNLLLPRQRAAAVDRLVELIAEAGTHLRTGFLSTPLLLRVLVEGGRSDIALALLFQTTAPSWLYQVERGATTVWETWEGYKENGYGKESHNHYALGAVAGWLTEGLSGLSPAAPGYRRIRISPVIAGQLDYASSTVDTPFGTARSCWRRKGGDIELEVDVPAGATAVVTGPWTSAESPDTTILGSGSHVLVARVGQHGGLQRASA